VNLRAERGRPLLIAHRGLPGTAPENSLEGIRAALEAGADVVEVDVAGRAGELVLAHSEDVAHAGSPGLDEALAHFAAHADPAVAIQLDVTPRGVEAPVTAALRSHGLVERALVSSTFADVLRRVRELEPGVATALGYPYDRAQVAERRLVPDVFVRAALKALRTTLPHRVIRMASAARADALSLHHVVVSAEAVRRCHVGGVAVLAWTVNDRAALDRVLAFGVDGVVTDDPGLLRGQGGSAGP
jgi:glycerophosphoryl diester phosphodiesterase